MYIIIYIVSSIIYIFFKILIFLYLGKDIYTMNLFKV